MSAPPHHIPPSTCQEDSSQPETSTAWEMSHAGSSRAGVMGGEGCAGLPQVSPHFALGHLVVPRGSVGPAGRRTMPNAHLASSCFDKLLCRSAGQTDVVPVSQGMELWPVTPMAWLAVGTVAVSLQREPHYLRSAHSALMGGDGNTASQCS